MGAWHFIRTHLNEISAKSFAYIGRQASSSPASGFHSIYKKEQAAILEQAIGRLPAEKGKAAAG
jgi:2-oxoglutarate dehydrogenase E1 component